MALKEFSAGDLNFHIFFWPDTCCGSGNVEAKINTTLLQKGLYEIVLSTTEKDKYIGLHVKLRSQKNKQ